MSQSYTDFVQACSIMCTEWSSARVATDWESAKSLQKHGITWMSITKLLPKAPNTTLLDRRNGDAYEHVDDDDDSEALTKIDSSDERVRVIYDIVHSPSYQVPVLYVSTKGCSLPSPSEIYELLMSEMHRPQLQAVGVMGALSMAEHPITSAPVFFVHPCRTAEAMRFVTGGREVSPEQYLMQWLGMVGTGVGLSVPVELAQSIVDTKVDAQTTLKFSSE